MKRTRTQGFTIPEMLVVIAVACILMAILFPVFAQTHCHSSRTCISNLKKLGAAVQMYLQDYDDTLFWNPAPGGLPVSHESSVFRPEKCAPQPHTSFMVLLYPYLKQHWTFKCPQYAGYDVRLHLGYRRSLMRAAFNPPGASATNPAGDPIWMQRIGYGFNEVLIGSPCRPRKLDSLKHDPAEVALLADAEEPWASGSGVWIREQGEWHRYWALKPEETPRHRTDQKNERWQNFMFMDGHAKLLKATATGGKQDGQRGYYPEAKLE
jgi:prepilin-type N-terminal cleavage/methylation domain-containing protein